MSIRLGILLSRTVSDAQLESIREKYNLGLKLIDNKYVAEQLTEDESFFQVSKLGCDDLTGIGAFELYNKDLTPLKRTITDSAMLDSIISEYQTRREGYKSDVIKWIQIIKDIKCNYKIKTVAIFWHFCSTSFEEEKIKFIKEDRCSLMGIDSEFLMKLPQDVVLYFS